LRPFVFFIPHYWASSGDLSSQVTGLQERSSIFHPRTDGVMPRLITVSGRDGATSRVAFAQVVRNQV
jgi:hypothetical protein